MDALTIRQPWAWAIVNGIKPVENRDWQTKVRGRIAIHAGKTFDQAAYESIKKSAKLGIIDLKGIALPEAEEFEMGGVVGTAELVDVVDQHDSPWFYGEYGFLLENAKTCNFIPARGMPGFFQFDTGEAA